jgi:hypothetical protein
MAVNSKYIVLAIMLFLIGGCDYDNNDKQLESSKQQANKLDSKVNKEAASIKNEKI